MTTLKPRQRGATPHGKKSSDRRAHRHAVDARAATGAVAQGPEMHLRGRPPRHGRTAGGTGEPTRKGQRRDANDPIHTSGGAPATRGPLQDGAALRHGRGRGARRAAGRDSSKWELHCTDLIRRPATAE